MHRFALVSVLFAVSSSTAHRRIGHDDAQQIDKDVAAILRRTETPGATILILRDERPLYQHAYGFRQLSDRLPASMDTRYEIGSITKQFTAAAILQLRDAGKIDIDARVSTYVPDAPHASEITVRQLLTHTSGLPDYLSAISDEAATKPASFEQIMSIVADKPLDFPPGSRASYSNTGFIILGRIIEQMSHESYRDYVRAHFFRVAGMSHSATIANERTLSLMAQGYRHVNGKRERGLTIDDSYAWSAGDIVSTVGDLEKWNEALLGGKIVSLADYAQMATPQITTDGQNSGYGFGLFIDTVNGQPRVGHTGGSYAFTTANFYYPNQKLRIIVFTNNADVPEPGEIAANAIFDDLYPELARAATLPAPDEIKLVTSKVRAAFAHLQSGTGDSSLFAESLDAKIDASLGKRMAGQFERYGAPTAFVYKGHRGENDRNWSDYLIVFGPGLSLKFSVALNEEAKVVSIGFNSF
jgi:D-alanyl-D-alanine carboxypeptidase